MIKPRRTGRMVWRPYRRSLLNRVLFSFVLGLIGTAAMNAITGSATVAWIVAPVFVIAPLFPMQLWLVGKRSAPAPKP